MTAPTKLNATQYPILQGATDTWHVTLDRPSVAGDTIIISGQTGSGGSNPITSIQDDKGNVLTVNKYQTGGQGALIASKQQIATGGSTKVTIVFSTPTTFTQFFGLCVNEIGTGAPVTGGNNPSGTSLTSAVLNTLALGESFVVAVFFEDSGQAITAPTRFTANGGAALWAADGVAWESVALYKKNVAANASVSLNVTSSNSFASGVSAIVAFPVQAGAGGGPGTGAEVGRTLRLNFNSSKANPWPITTFTFDLPLEPDLTCIAVGYTDANIFHAGVPGNISTSPSNSFSDRVQISLPGGVAAIGWASVENASVSLTGSMTVTVTSAPATQNIEFQLYIQALRNVRAFGTAQSGSGTLNTVPPVTQNNVLGTALTTTENNQVLLMRTQEVQQTPTVIAASAGTAIYTMPDVHLYESFDLTHDEGHAVLYAASPGSYNFNTSYVDNEGGLVVSGWAAAAISFLPTVAGSLPSRGMPRGLARGLGR